MDKIKSKVSAVGGKSQKLKKVKTSGKIWERLVPLSEATREWDVDFWQSRKAELRFLTAWGMVADYYKIKGKKIGKNTLRLQRTVEHIKQAQS
ncbi:MAG: hypothetical protein ABH836_03815 [Candidatus Omnitrophota bacterium]